MRRLILVEGLPCSGKSTAARYIAQALGLRYVDEGTGAHPADYEFHAYVTERDLPGFSPEERQMIQAVGERRADGWIVPLARLDDRVPERLLARKIYDFLPWEAERPLMLDRWRRFAERIAPDAGYVFNCVLLQNPMCETMMRFGFDVAASAAYIGEICRIIRPLDPFVIYLKTDHIRALIEKALPERGEDWLNAVIDYHCGGAYGRALGLSGMEGYIAALEERQRREIEILRGLDVERLILENPDHDWPGAYARMLERLKENEA